MPKFIGHRMTAIVIFLDNHDRSFLCEELAGRWGTTTQSIQKSLTACWKLGLISRRKQRRVAYTGSASGAQPYVYFRTKQNLRLRRLVMVNGSTGNYRVAYRDRTLDDLGVHPASPLVVRAGKLRLVADGQAMRLRCV